MHDVWLFSSEKIVFLFTQFQLSHFRCNESRDLLFSNGPRREKTCLRRFANNKGADQPAHPRSLISAFVIHCLESTISKLTTSEISTF